MHIEFRTPVIWNTIKYGSTRQPGMINPSQSIETDDPDEDEFIASAVGDSH
jgi:hypothetical protein